MSAIHRSFATLTCCLCVAAVLGLGTAVHASPTIVLRPADGPTPEAIPPLPPPGPLDVQLVLDDGVGEGSVGVTQGAGARQFLWFNRFQAPAGEFDLEQIWVLFPADPALAAGLAIDLVVFHDPDGDPTNGATFLAAVSETIQVVDGVTFSIYDLAPTVAIPAGGDVLLGVVNRFVTSGVSPPSFPAALDSTASQMRSWVATWSGDPPSPPALPTDGTMALVDSFPGLGGNWMIRGLGSETPSALAIPALGLPGLLAMVAALALIGLRRVRGGQREVAS
jgi:hypothetical protein